MVQNAGEVVELAVRRQNINISDLSRRLQVNRRTLYNWFQQKKLPAEIIFTIGHAIEHDFTIDFQEDFMNFKPPAIPEKKDTGENPPGSSSSYWMEKYISLLEDYKDLLQHIRSEHPVNKERLV